MATNVAVMPQSGGEIMENVIARGDLGKLSPEERARYYTAVCQSVGLNPLTRPFEYITLNGKLTLYARKDCTDQLRAVHKVSVTDLNETHHEGVLIVTAKVVDGAGRTDMAKGAVSLGGLKGEALANAIMKAETKAKRRATLSICGLGMLDETEVEDIEPAAKTLPKKDAKDIYTKLQREIDTATSRPQLKQWCLDNADRIKVMPEDWQDILRLRAEEKMADLRQQETQPQQTIAPPVHDDGLDIPPELDRRKPKQANGNGRPEYETDPEGALKWVESALLTIVDPEQLETVWNDKIAPFVETMFPPDQEEAIGLYRKRERELEP